MNRNRRPRPAQQGYVMMIVMILIIVLTSAGIYGLRSVEGDLKASASVRRSESATYAAEAGVAARMSELMLATEDAGAGLTSAVEGNDINYPPAPTGNIPTSIVRVVAEPVVAVSANPPPGVQVGSGGQVTMWRVDSFAVTRIGSTGLLGSGVPGNSQRISVGMSMWSRGGLSYNIN